MRYLIEKNNYYNIGDKVLIEYWYNSMITVVVIIDKIKTNYVISHNIEESKIFNAPNETIKSVDIIDIYR